MWGIRAVLPDSYTLGSHWVQRYGGASTLKVRGFARAYSGGKAADHVDKLQMPFHWPPGVHILPAVEASQNPDLGPSAVTHFSVAHAQPCLRPQNRGFVTE